MTQFKIIGDKRSILIASIISNSPNPCFLQWNFNDYGLGKEIHHPERISLKTGSLPIGKPLGIDCRRLHGLI